MHSDPEQKPEQQLNISIYIFYENYTLQSMRIRATAWHLARDVNALLLPLKQRFNHAA
jgi:hypothetical protein